MKKAFVLCAALMIGVMAVWAGDALIKLAPGSVTLLGEPEVKQFDEMKVAAAYLTASSYAPEGGFSKDQAGVWSAYDAMMTDGYDKLKKYKEETGVTPVGPSYGQYFEDPSMTDPTKLTAKLGFPVKGDVKPAADVKIEVLPAMTAVVLKYKGAYKESNNAWTTVMDWAKKKGYEFAGPVMEIYVTGPWDVKDPSQFVTEIRVPVKKVPATAPVVKP